MTAARVHVRVSLNSAGPDFRAGTRTATSTLNFGEHCFVKHGAAGMGALATSWHLPLRARQMAQTIE